MEQFYWDWLYRVFLGPDRVRFRKWSNRVANLSGLALVLFSFVVSSSGDDDSNSSGGSTLWNQKWTFYIGVAFPCLVGLALSNVLGRYAFRLSKPECVTIAVECAYQNVAIAASVAVTMFGHDEVSRSQALIVPLYYGLVEAVVIGVYCLWAWKWGWTKAPAKEPFCVVITNTYEVDNENDEKNKMDDGENKKKKNDMKKKKKKKRKKKNFFIMASIMEGKNEQQQQQNYDDNFDIDEYCSSKNNNNEEEKDEEDCAIPPITMSDVMDSSNEDAPPRARLVSDTSTVATLWEHEC